MDRDPGDQRRASLRASDADRERLVEALRQHHAEGRLTTEELEERAGRAYAAKTFGDLDALTTDLPPVQPPAVAPGPRAADLPPRLRPPGSRQAAAKATLLRTIVWFGAVSLLLIAIWALTGGDYFWPVWPILGFMVAIVWQSLVVWGPRPYDDHDPRDPRRP
jgi:hypothetical protein